MSKRKVVSTSQAPAAIGPYSQAIKAGKFLFASGQFGLDPTTGNLQEGIEAQTRKHSPTSKLCWLKLALSSKTW